MSLIIYLAVVIPLLRHLGSFKLWLGTAREVFRTVYLISIIWSKVKNIGYVLTNFQSSSQFTLTFLSLLFLTVVSVPPRSSVENVVQRTSPRASPLTLLDCGRMYSLQTELGNGEVSLYSICLVLISLRKSIVHILLIEQSQLLSKGPLLILVLNKDPPCHQRSTVEQGN